MEKIIMYSTGCPKCIVLKRKLDAAAIDYEICEDVGTMEKLGMTTVPVLSVDGEFMDFGSAVRWINGGANGEH